MNSIVGISIHRYDKCTVYGIRGTGLAYSSLYELLNKLKDKFVNVWDDWPWHYIKFNDQQSQDQFEQYIHTAECSIDDRGIRETTFEHDWPTFAKYSQ